MGTRWKPRWICSGLQKYMALIFSLTTCIYCVYLFNFHIFQSSRNQIPDSLTKRLKPITKEKISANNLSFEVETLKKLTHINNQQFMVNNLTFENETLRRLTPIIKEQFIAENLTFEKGTLKLFGRYTNEFYKHTENNEQRIQLEIKHVHRLILELLDSKRNKTKPDMISKTKITETGKVILHGSDTLYKSYPEEHTTKQHYSKHIYNQYFKTNRNVEGVNCKKLFENDKTEQTRANELSKRPITAISPEEYINMTKNCESYVQEKGYILDTLSPEEKDFPIAYSILMFKEVAQFEKLLRAIYRPQNYYCIHVDKKSSEELFSAVSGIASCFENVFTSSTRIDVQWGEFSVLQPELVCMYELLKYKWKYFINLTGQEFPLRTNKELVQILNIYNGANDLEGTLKRADPNRWIKAGKPPHNIQPVKGSVHITVNRDFVNYIVKNKTAHDFINWTRNVDFPDETLFSSLNHNPQLGIRGTYKGDKETDINVKPFLTRFKNWGTGIFNWPCRGRRVRMICVFGAGDLPLLYRRPELFANKFYFFYQPYALQCMEELHFNRTRDEFSQNIAFNTTFYQNLSFLKNVV